MKNKILNRILMLIITVCLCFSFVACSSDDVDHTKTQLYIGIYSGGIGDQWLKTLGDQFEEQYKDVSFEEGKTGVEIWIDPGNDNFTSTQLISSMPSSRQDIYFTQDVDYAYAVSKGCFADISDIVTEKYDTVDLGDGEKTYSIEDKIEGYIKDYFKIDQKYYALPYAAPVYGVMYDVDLFCDKGLYFKADGSIGGSIDNPNNDLSSGPDGISGTYDDGLPATWNQFIELMDMMVRRNVIPFTWSGTYKYQRVSYIRSIWASYEGFNDYILNNTLSGTTSDGIAINDDNAYELVNKKGRLASSMAAYDIVSNPDYYSQNAFKISQTNTFALEEFLSSNPIYNKPIGMLLEGGYWENEARGIFNDIVDQTDESNAMGARRFSYMPVPKFVGTPGIPDQTNNEQVLVSTLNSLCFVNAATSKLDLAKKFMKFLHTNDSLSTFNSVSGVTRGYKYNMSDDDYDKMSYYQKSVYDIAKKANFSIIQGSYVSSKLRRQNQDYFKYWESNIVRINNTQYDEPMISFSNNPQLTAQDWYDSYKNNYNASSWQNKKLP